MEEFKTLKNLYLKRHLQSGWLKSIKWFLGYSLLTLSLLFVFNIYLISTEDIFEVPIKEKIAIDDITKVKELRGLEIINQVKITNPTLLDRVIIGPLYNEFYLFSIFFGALICWQLIKILNDLDLYYPFTVTIAKRIKIISWLLILTSVFYFIRYAYTYWVVLKMNVNGRLVLDYNNVDLQAFKYGILLFIIYKVYLFGCNLQTEQDLTV
jgi:hypothetical protein